MCHLADPATALSQACERGLAAAVAEQRRQRWLEENGEAITA